MKKIHPSNVCLFLCFPSVMTYTNLVNNVKIYFYTNNFRFQIFNLICSCYWTDFGQSQIVTDEVLMVSYTC